jgi:putative phosphoesterase
MKIAIISDTHDNELNLIKALTLINQEKVSALIHCGDVCFYQTLMLILKNFSKRIYLSLGNGDSKDSFLRFKQKKLKIFEKFGEIKLANKKIAITHFYDLAQNLAKENKYDFIFYGHTHFPWKEKMNQKILLNPGNLAGLIYPPTFCIYDLKNLEEKLIKL